jgi:eukaryotic-like serine/threonine-protein kinase
VSTARATVAQAKFQVNTVKVPDRKPAGIVVGESPAAGTKADKGSTVTLSVSTGPGKVPIPPVQGLSQAAATRELRHAGLKVGNVVPRASNQFPAGQATGTNPGVAHSVPHGFSVTLFISSGPAQKTVPPVVGETQTQATTDLEHAGFQVRPRSQQSSTTTAGNVISQDPGGNTKAAAGSTVTITVATAPATVTVPPVTGDPVSGAVNALKAAGFHVVQTTQTVTNAAQNGTVVAQTPGGNTTAKKGTTVTITVGKLSSSGSSTTSTTKTTTTSTSSTPTTTTHG